MNPGIDAKIVVLGGLSGIVGTACYVLATTVPFGLTATYVLAMSWPVLSIVFIFSLYRYIGSSTQTSANQLAFMFGCLAFAMVAAMISIQLAVRTGIEEQAAGETSAGPDVVRLVRSSLRLVDLGLDVAWDIFIGVALLFLAAALKAHSDFGIWWGIPSALLAAGLLVLNVATYPWPPDTRGLFDIGPAVGLYIVILSSRLLLLGLRKRRQEIASGPQ